jgi:peptide/nickel transport system substrate-binding protein
VQAIGAVPTPSVASVEANSQLRFSSTPSEGAVYAVYLNTERGPFTDERVRTAFQRAIDVGTLVRTVHFGVYERAWSILSPATPGYDPSLAGSWPYDPALANRLLDQAGWSARDADGYRVRDGQRLSVRWPTTPQQDEADQRGVLGQGVQAAERAVGIEVVRDNVPNGTLYGLITDSKYDLFDMSWSRADPDILRGFLDSASMPMTGQNIARVHDATVDAWVEGATATLDEKTRTDAYHRAQRWAVEHATVVPLYVPAYLLAADRSVHGLTADPAGFPLFYDAWVAK